MFSSEFHHLGQVDLPDFSGTRVMMLPFVLEDPQSVPDELSHYRFAIAQLVALAPCRKGVAYLTIDEKTVLQGSSHRRPGLHVDGIYRDGSGGWGGGGGWGTNGLLTVASHIGCRAWRGRFPGKPGPEGECMHLLNECREDEATVFKPFHAYWLNGLCVHESIAQPNTIARQFVRLSMPSDAPWFLGYTENPKGIRPTGPILGRRKFMAS